LVVGGEDRVVGEQQTCVVLLEVVAGLEVHGQQLVIVEQREEDGGIVKSVVQLCWPSAQAEKGCWRMRASRRTLSPRLDGDEEGWRWLVTVDRAVE
jgi:hypothetical protein